MRRLVWGAVAVGVATVVGATLAFNVSGSLEPELGDPIRVQPTPVQSEDPLPVPDGTEAPDEGAAPVPPSPSQPAGTGCTDDDDCHDHDEDDDGDDDDDD